MNKISLCMIIKNEELVLDRCLKSVKDVVDEIIIVDTGSSDNSINIAKKYTDKIYHFSWCDDFAKARNFSFSKANFEYIMWLDADDIIPKKTRNEILKLKENMSADTIFLKYTMLDNFGKKSLTFFRERIVRNCEYAVWAGSVHECITPFGNIERKNIEIYTSKVKPPTPQRNLKIYKKLLSLRKLSARETYYYARELHDNKKYHKSITYFKKFLEFENTWIENIIDAKYMIALNYFTIGNLDKALTYALSTLNHTTPRPNVCCLIGDIFLTKSNYIMSIYWYKLAIKTKIKDNDGFNDLSFNNIYPYLNLSVCYYNLGDLSNAIKYNNKARNINKDNYYVKKNIEFFNSLIKKDG